MRPFLTILLLFAVFCFGCAQKPKTPTYEGKPVRYWEIQAASKEAAKRRVAAQALGKLGPVGLPALMKLQEDTDHRVRAAATLAVKGMGLQAVPKLKKLIHDPNKTIQKGAAKALADALVDMRGGRGVRQLIPLLEDSEPDVRFEAAKAIMRVDRKSAATAIPALKKLLRTDENRSVRQAAGLTLALLEPPKQKFKPLASPAVKRQ
jgi:HEAT repeat protein